MKKIILTATALIFTLISAGVNASLITIESRGINSGIINTDFVTSWNNQTTAITSSPLNNFFQNYSGNNTINHLSVDFSVALSGSWGFQIGLDAGYGAAFYLDGALIENRTDDLWWAYNWASTDVMTSLDNIVTPGAHTLDFYWAENCCNGYSSARFTTDGANWLSLSTENIDAVSVPAPTTTLLLGLGLIGFVVNRRKQK